MKVQARDLKPGMRVFDPKRNDSWRVLLVQPAPLVGLTVLGMGGVRITCRESTVFHVFEEAE